MRNPSILNHQISNRQSAIIAIINFIHRSIIPQPRLELGSRAYQALAGYKPAALPIELPGIVNNVRS